MIMKGEHTLAVMKNNEPLYLKLISAIMITLILGLCAYLVKNEPYGWLATYSLGFSASNALTVLCKK